MSPTAAKKSASRRVGVPASTATSVHPSPALDELTGAGNHDALGSRHQVLGLERVEVDPKTLVLDANTRSELKITPEFKAMLAEHGVLVPLLCRRDVLGNLLVVDGQRRLIVALELGLALVPIAMLPPVGDEEARIWDQLVTNAGRESLTDGEQVKAFEQLAAFGRSATTIAKKTGRSKVTVEQALTVAASKAASTSMATHPDLTIDQLAVLAEFENDPETVKELEESALDGPGDFAHTAQSFRENRRRAAAIATFAAGLPEGTVVLDERPSYSSKDCEQIDSLKDKQGGVALTAEGHADCPGHRAYLSAYPDWSNDSSDRGYKVQVTYFCIMWKDAGHVNRHAQASSGATSGPQDEAQKADRRALIANNKAADASFTVRRAWIHTFLQRDVMPKDAESYVAEVLHAGRREPLDHALARELLYGDKTMTERDLLRDFARPGPALCYLVALAAAQAEHGWARDFWHARTSYEAPPRVAHLLRLKAWGYTLADVEQLAIDTHTKKAS